MSDLSNVQFFQKALVWTNWTTDIVQINTHFLTYINTQIYECVCSVRNRTLAVRRTFDEKSGAQLR